MVKRKRGRPSIPKSKQKKVDYKRRYKKFTKNNPQAKAAKVRRQKARRAAVRAWKVKKGDGKHIHHAAWQWRGKGRVVSAKYNLSRKEGSRKKWSKRNKSKRGK